MATYGDQVEMGSDHSDEVEMHEQNVEMDLIVKSKAVRAFLENPDIHNLYQLKVDDLHKLAEVYEITVSDAPKGDLQRQIMTALVRKEVLGRISGNESEREEGQLSGNAESNKCDWRAQVEIEKIRAEKELKLKEMENKIRLKEIEVFGAQGGRNAGGGGDDRVSQLPEFIEGEAEDFFIQFEKLATIRKWERSDWAMLVQAKFTGKAREAFAGLSLHDSVRYHRVKEAVLKTSEMTPEVYRRKLRSMKKTDGQTYGEMARESTMRFERWCKSERVEDFEDLKQLMLLEHFTERAHPDIRYEICRSRIKNITDAAQLADELTVMRKMCTGQVSHKPVGIRNVGHAYGRNDQRVGHFDYRQDHYNHQRSQPHYVPQYQERSKPRNPPQYNPMRQQNFNGYVNRQERSHVKCYGCGESGHVQYQCRKVSKSAGLTVASRKPQVSLDVEPKRKEKIVDSFQPFITEGTISLPGGAKKQIKILRDTGANLSLVLRETLDWTESSYTGEEARIRGVVAGTNTPLHYVEIDTGYVSGKVEVGVREELPINGVDMLLGNDLAGDKVVPEPIMIAKPLGNVKDGNVDVQGEGDVLDIGIRKKVQSECGNGEGTTVAGSKESLSGGEVNASEESADDGNIQRIYPACVVTRAMMRNKETNDEDMGLGDIFDEEKEHKPVKDESVEMKLEISPDFNVGRKELIEAQRNDPTLKECFGEANRNGVSDDRSTGFYLHDHSRLMKARELVAENLKNAQQEMKKWEEEKTEVPELSCGAVNAEREMDDGEEEKFSRCEEKNLENSMVLENLGAKLNHLSSERRDDIIHEIHKCGTLFSDTPRRCTVLEHDVDVGLTERAREISAFATMDGLYQYRVMPFGMRNSGSTFQRLINKVLAGVTGYASLNLTIVFQIHNDASSYQRAQRAADGTKRGGRAAGAGSLGPRAAACAAVSEVSAPTRCREIHKADCLDS
ncbi:uncharacterized protein LOC143029531 [Oratosquilla oratoria]|uniref:uncharacterized protein LOC143029531 n=1 Tax=Oratosquilla oratoria TaxID=337810 RepID=UPI003F76D837